MASTIYATGTIAEPKLDFGSSGKARLKIRLNTTARRKDRQTGEWADWGDQLWYSATFWDKRAEELMEMLRRVPRRTDTVSWGGYRFEVMDVDNYRIDQVLITRTLQEQITPPTGSSSTT